jgi:hypothetical protein
MALTAQPPLEDVHFALEVKGYVMNSLDPIRCLVAAEAAV